MLTRSQSQKELMGFVYGFLGVLVFSLTLPATRVAVSGFDPIFVGLGRAIVAAGLSLILLVATRQTIPPLRFLPKFGIVVAGVVIGFPLLSAIAMRDAPASYGAVITGLLPLSTALSGVWRAGERPSFARSEAKIIGAVRLCPETDFFVLRRMQVLAPFQRQGIGKQLLQSCTEHLADRACYCIPWQHLRLFYQQAKFQEVSPSQAPVLLRERFNSYISREMSVILMCRLPTPTLLR
jgi:GNAT superfamily N-acetyltransferase